MSVTEKSFFKNPKFYGIRVTTFIYYYKIENNYCIDAYRTPAFYKNMRVSNGVIFEICGVLIKFLLKKWTFGAKKWRFIQICPKWRSNQDWPSICVDTVVIQ